MALKLTVTRVESVSRKIQRNTQHPSYFHPSSFLGPLVVWPKAGEHTELLRISKEWRGLRFSSYLPSTYLRIYKAT
jgi:hypothetical protein